MRMRVSQKGQTSPLYTQYIVESTNYNLYIVVAGSDPFVMG